MSDAAKVGLFALVISVIAAYFVLRIENVELRGGRREYKVRLENAQGLIIKSPVYFKGVKVGRVVDLELNDDYVMATLSVPPGIILREGTRATVASVGLLGEKELELSPGPPGAPPLTATTPIVAEQTATLDTVISQMGRVGKDVKAITGEVRETVEDARLKQLLEALTELLVEMKTLVAANQTDANAALVSVRRMADAIRGVASDLGKPSAEGQGVGGSGAPSATENLRVAAANLEDLTGRVTRGEGALGKLIYSSDTSQKLDQALTSVDKSAGALSNAVSALSRTTFSLSLRADYLTGLSKPRGQAQLDILPPGRAFLRLGATTEPTGLRTERVIQAMVVGPDGSARPESVQEAVREQGVGLTLMGGWRAGPVALRAGVLESRAGVGADLLLWRDRLRFTAEGWDFGQTAWRPQLRAEAAFAPVRWGALIAGWEDPLNADQQLDSFYLGVGLRFAPETE